MTTGNQRSITEEDLTLAANPDPTEEHEPYPWETSAVLPEDKAMGLELELIELEHERDEAEHEGAPVEAIDEEITEVLDELEDVVEDVTEGAETIGTDAGSHVEIHAPEAAELTEHGGHPGP